MTLLGFATLVTSVFLLNFFTFKELFKKKDADLKLSEKMPFLNYAEEDRTKK